MTSVHKQLLIKALGLLGTHLNTVAYFNTARQTLQLMLLRVKKIILMILIVLDYQKFNITERV